MSDKKTPQEIPDHVIASFARCLLPAIRGYFDSEEGKRKFAEWKTMNDKNNVIKSMDK